jgi:hypothetical protein
MKRINIIVLIIIIFNITLLQAYDWPIKEDTTQHQINATLGEYKSGPPKHFHAGVDVKAPCSTKVYAIDGDTCYKDLVSSPRGINNKIEEMKFREITLDFNLKYTIILLIE